MLEKNQQAPIFSSKNQLNQLVICRITRVKRISFYIFIQNDTPGCTIEANDFTRLAEEFSNTIRSLSV